MTGQFLTERPAGPPSLTSYHHQRRPPTRPFDTSLLDEHRRDFTSCSLEFDSWCIDNIKPWFSDHVHCDAELIRRWSGHDVELTRPLPSDLIVAAAAVDPEMFQVVGPYLAMLALPAGLAAVEPRAREIYASGWRPPVPDGPTRDELAALVAGVSARSAGSR